MADDHYYSSIKECQTTSWENSNNGNVPAYAVKAGFSKTANSDIYVCRVNKGDQIVLGKVVPALKRAFILMNDKEEQVREYEVLTDPNDLLKWVNPGKNGGIPWGAVPGGYDKDRMTTFIARATLPKGDDFSQSSGMYVPQTKKCMLPWYGQEVAASSFEILVQK